MTEERSSVISQRLTECSIAGMFFLGREDTTITAGGTFLVIKDTVHLPEQRKSEQIFEGASFGKIDRVYNIQ